MELNTALAQMLGWDNFSALRTPADLAQRLAQELSQP